MSTVIAMFFKLQIEKYNSVTIGELRQIRLFCQLLNIYMITEDKAHNCICTLKFTFLSILIILNQIMFIIFLDVLSLKNMKKMFPKKFEQNEMVFNREHVCGLRAPRVIRVSLASFLLPLWLILSL